MSNWSGLQCQAQVWKDHLRELPWQRPEKTDVASIKSNSLTTSILAEKEKGDVGNPLKDIKRTVKN